MIVNETIDARTGDHYAEAIDLQAGTATLTINGQLWEERPLTAEEVAAHTPPVDRRVELAQRAAKATTVAAMRAVLVELLELDGAG